MKKTNRLHLSKLSSNAKQQIEITLLRIFNFGIVAIISKRCSNNFYKIY